MKAFVAKQGFVRNHVVPKLGTALDDVLIQVKAFGINRPDLIQHSANYPPPPGVTDVLGLELSGVVVEANNDKLVGEEVCCLVPGGSYSEYCSAKWGTCLPIPFKGTDSDRFVKSAGIPENAFTVWRNVFRDYDLDHLSSQNVSMLFHGGSSGIGSTAIAMAKAFGVSKVIVTAGSEEKCDACLRFGADVAINYNDESEDGKLDWTTKAGKVDFILDMVGGEYLNQNLKILNTNGKLAIIGFLQSPMSTVNMTRVMLKSLHITGSVLRSQPQSFKELLALEIQDHVWPLVESGALQLPANISHVYRGIESVDDALSVMQGSSHIGKIVVEV